ncbi:unnamed protein product [Adineta steineri]|uniref:Uncharacterized protein n=1 Tax=Adineta steineri TaxID=433720 RepID=A0A815SFN3_9BILA|nr:unnamed protein product [Adineta steineri]CAF4189570.1 unnamed protein product [Adineta steineri]
MLNHKSIFCLVPLFLGAVMDALLNISNLNVQSYGMELLSSTHNLTEEQSLNVNNNNNNQLYQAQKKNKNISYDDRKVLSAKRRVHHQQEKLINNLKNHLNQHIIKIDGDDQINVRQEDEEQQQQIHIRPLNDHHQIRSSNKHKYHELNQAKTNINQLFSQLTISQENLRKKKTLKRTRSVTYTVSF